MTFQSEKWPAVKEEMKALVPRQWEEIALDKDQIKLDPDYERYDHLHNNGVLQIITVREGRELVGWYITIVSLHLHYRTTLFGFLDIYYVLPEHRSPTTGMNLFMAVEQRMKELGVREMVSISKNHRSVNALFDRLGWRRTGTTFTKVL